jgi:hypothetical protein
MASPQPGASFGRRIEALALTPVLLIVTLGIGWLVWSVVEWRNGRTPSYRLLGLRVGRRDGGKPIGFARSLARSGVCCTLLVVPTVLICGVVAVSFAIGASAPDGLLREPRAAPWDRLTDTEVIDERVPVVADPAPESEITGPVGITEATPTRTEHQNGHVPQRPRSR